MPFWYVCEIVFFFSHLHLFKGIQNLQREYEKALTVIQNFSTEIHQMKR